MTGANLDVFVSILTKCGVTFFHVPPVPTTAHGGVGVGLGGTQHKIEKENQSTKPT